MDLRNYLNRLPDREAKAQFAIRAKTTLGHLDHLEKGRKKPKTLTSLMDLIHASDGELTLRGLRPDLFSGSKRNKRNLEMIHNASKEARP